MKEDIYIFPAQKGENDGSLDVVTFPLFPHSTASSLIKATIPHDLCKYSMLCYVVGSRRLMPPDALQPKVYCTNAGL